MLHGINPAISPELLYILARMGHGDELVLVDANYPAASTAQTCTVPDVVTYPGMSSAEVADLITELMPLDNFHTYGALRMEVDEQPNEVNAVHQDVFAVLTPRLPEGATLGSIERQAFYAKAKTCFAVVQCSEMRAFGCFILRKGVIF